MIIHGRRNSRTCHWLLSWRQKSLTEYLSPAREQGTKMLKLKPAFDLFAIYRPHHPNFGTYAPPIGYGFRPSYAEDVMNDRKLTEMYNAEIIGEEEIDGTKTKVLELTAKVEDVAYHSRKIWVDTEKYVPLKEELFAKKRTVVKTNNVVGCKKLKGAGFQPE